MLALLRAMSGRARQSWWCFDRWSGGPLRDRAAECPSAQRRHLLLGLLRMLSIQRFILLSSVIVEIPCTVLDLLTLRFRNLELLRRRSFLSIGIFLCSAIPLLDRAVEE